MAGDLLGPSERLSNAVLVPEPHSVTLPSCHQAVNPVLPPPTFIASPSKSPEADVGEKGQEELGGDIYHISFNPQQGVPNLFTRRFLGILAEYLLWGLVYGTTTSILYPVLVVKNLEEPNFLTAAYAMVMIFYTYKVFYGLLADCVPIAGMKRKPYIILGWLLSAGLFMGLALQGKDVSSVSLVLFLALANFAYVLSDTVSDGMVVWIAHREPLEKRGKAQTLVYLFLMAGRTLGALLVGFFFSGPTTTCPGYEPDPTQPCTSDRSIIQRTEWGRLPPSRLPFDWCHRVCSSALFTFEISLSQLAWILAATQLMLLPSFYFFIYDEPAVRKKVKDVLQGFWDALQRRAVWQLSFYLLFSHLLFGITNNAQTNTLHIWLRLSPLQKSLLDVFENLIFISGILLIRQYFLNVSWHRLVIVGSLLQVSLSSLYLLIVFKIWRNPWFYIVSDVSVTFTGTLNHMVGTLCIAEVCPQGYEAAGYAMVSAANNLVRPLSAVLSNQVSSLFSLSNADLRRDDKDVHMQYFYCWLLTVAINLSSLLVLPLLPNQKKEARELYASGDSSSFWRMVLLSSYAVCMVYGTVSNLLALFPEIKCHKVLGGSGCVSSSQHQTGVAKGGEGGGAMSSPSSSQSSTPSSSAVRPSIATPPPAVVAAESNLGVGILLAVVFTFIVLCTLALGYRQHLSRAYRWLRTRTRRSTPSSSGTQ